MKTGKIYIASGEFELINIIKATVPGIIIASVMGVVYAFISELNPFIYLNCLVLMGLLFAISYFVQKISRYAKNRNKAVSLIVGLIISFFAWYAHWCFYFVSYMEDVSYFAAFFNPVETFWFVKLFSEERVITLTNSGSSSNGTEFSGIFLQITYLAEFLGFMLFPIFNRKPEYFSEDQQCFYSSVVKYTENNEDFAESFKKASPGCYGFLSQKDIYNTLNDIPLENRSKVVKLDFHYCDEGEGEDNSILTITEGVFKINKKKECSFSSGKKLIKDMYVDAETNEAILNMNTHTGG